MSDSKSQASMDGDDHLAFEREWADARRAAGMDPERAGGRGSKVPDEPLAEVSPLTLLYTGFLLGPPTTFAVTLLLVGRKLRLRTLIFVLGVCGAAWCVIQAATFGLAGDWTVVELQMLRTGANFTGGLLLIWFLRVHTEAPFGHDRQTLINTAVLGALLVVGYVLLPDTALMWLGR
ncbi:MAG: hypothetical protein ACLFVJ_10310 [Persicimonas sp.]